MKKEPLFIHQVYFWLNEKADDSVKQSMTHDCETRLRQIPGVMNLWTGVPAQIPREVVDNTFDLGMLIFFADRNAHDSYQIHPVHKEFTKTYRPYWKKVQVYDFQSSPPS